MLLRNDNRKNGKIKSMGLIGPAILIAFLALAVFPKRAQAVKEWVFPKGSYIIPMDSQYQPDGDSGVFEAYGLVYKLLQQGITVYWCVNEEKTSPNGVDFSVLRTSGDPPYPSAPVTVINDSGDGASIPTDVIEYIGGPFVINTSRPDVKQLVDQIISDWNTENGEDVNIHRAERDFVAPVSRIMRGTPPKIALLDEGKNVTILQNYLILAGLGSYEGMIYDLVTPQDIINGAIDQNPYTGEEPYNILWAPHWEGSNKYTSKTWDPTTQSYVGSASGTLTEQEETIVVQKIADFLDRGNALFAECASIEVFEWHPNGHFLASSGFAKNGLKNGTSITYHYNDPTSPYTQIGDWTFDLEGGHLHNWKAIPIDDATYPVGSGYNATVVRYLYGDGTLDTGYSGPSTDGNNWDMYVAGHYKGDSSKGYVVYLGGHKYVQETTVGGTKTCVKWDKKKNKCKQWKIIGGTVTASPINTAAVRYILNTLLNLRYDVIPKEYVRSSPVTTSDNQMFLGSFEYPGFKGHFRSYNANLSNAEPGDEYYDSALLIPSADNRIMVFDRNGSLLEFNTQNISASDVGISDSGTSPFTSLEILINSFRGKTAKQDKVGNWYYEESWKLGPVKHSTPALVTYDNITVGNQPLRVAFVADGWGVLHAFYAPIDSNPSNDTLDASLFSGTVLGHSLTSVQPGGELWAYLPGDYIPYLHDQRNMVTLDVSPKVAKVLVFNESTQRWEYRTLLAVSRGDGGTGITVFDISDPLNPTIFLVTDQITYVDPDTGESIKLGHTRSVAFGKVGNGKTYLFLATDSQKTDQNGNVIPGITIAAINLNSSTTTTPHVSWAFFQDYLKQLAGGGTDIMAPNDIPAGPTVIDSNFDGYVDIVFAGDSAGRLWALNTLTGESIYGNDDNGNPLPLANMGEDYPIGATPTPYIAANGHVNVLFGTGGQDWAPETNTYGVYCYDASTTVSNPTYESGAALQLWSYTLEQGEKVYASILKVSDYIYFGTSFGSLESLDPTVDVPDTAATNTGNFYALDLGGQLVHKLTNVGKVRASAEVEGDRIYFTALKGESDVVGVVASTKLYLKNLSEFGTSNQGGSQGNLLHTPYWREIVPIP